jgi:microcystin-dependent protein
MSDSIPIGTCYVLCLTSANPEEWLLADGRLLERDEFPDLFEAIGTSFGSESETDFRISASALAYGYVPGEALHERAIMPFVKVRNEHPPPT